MAIPTESILSAAERTVKYKAEVAKQAEEAKAAQAQRAEWQRRIDAETRQQQDALLENIGQHTGDEALALIHDHIRKMREEPAPAPVRMPLTDRMREKLEAEQAYGRMIVERNRVEMEASQALRFKRQQEEAAKQPMLTPVIHPNPGQDEQFPAAKSTLGPKMK